MSVAGARGAAGGGRAVLSRLPPEIPSPAPSPGQFRALAASQAEKLQNPQPKGQQLSPQTPKPLNPKP